MGETFQKFEFWGDMKKKEIESRRHFIKKDPSNMPMHKICGETF